MLSSPEDVTAWIWNLSNLISGNNNDGFDLGDAGADSGGNLIGTTANGFTALGNNSAGINIGNRSTANSIPPPPGEGGGSGSTGGQEGQVLDLVRTLGPAVVTPCPKYYRLLCR